ncbi:MAG: hypothetical protein Q7S22_06755 [Candidatus Micrarchaeota archaeon]|nr:hypothetical protein [Candidatus Micrarchaeota archaeon]
MTTTQTKKLNRTERCQRIAERFWKRADVVIEGIQERGEDNITETALQLKGLKFCERMSASSKVEDRLFAADQVMILRKKFQHLNVEASYQPLLVKLITDSDPIVVRKMAKNLATGENFLIFEPPLERLAGKGDVNILDGIVDGLLENVKMTEHSLDPEVISICTNALVPIWIKAGVTGKRELFDRIKTGIENADNSVFSPIFRILLTDMNNKILQLGMPTRLSPIIFDIFGIVEKNYMVELAAEIEALSLNPRIGGELKIAVEATARSLGIVSHIFGNKNEMSQA